MPLVSFERILSLVKLHTHVRSAVDEHRLVLLGPFFLLTQVLDYRCLQSGLCGNLTLVAHASDTVRFIHRRESINRESLVHDAFCEIILQTYPSVGIFLWPLEMFVEGP